jgi:hypothetical protein
LEDAAFLEWTPAVERVAIVALGDSNGSVVESAARPLSELGSASARQSLEFHLTRVRSHIADARRMADGGASPLRDRDIEALEDAERALAQAMLGAKRWTLTLDERAELARRCTDGHGCNHQFDSYRSWDPPDQVSGVRPRVGHERELQFWIDSFPGRSIEDVEQKLRQYPVGTKVYWDDRPGDMDDSLERWTWSERDRLFERVRLNAGRYGVIVQRERTLIPNAAAPRPVAGR